MNGVNKVIGTVKDFINNIFGASVYGVGTRPSDRYSYSEGPFGKTGQTPMPSSSPAPQYTPSPQPQQQYNQSGGFKIKVPGYKGDVEIPPQIAQILGNELDKYGLATEAARVLTHPLQQTYTPEEVKQYGHENYNIGENPRFITQNVPGQDINTQQANGTWDMGLMRNNDATFKLLQGSHKWNTILKQNGLTDVSQLDDPTLSVRYAKILGDYYEQDLGKPRWMAWFAAPLDLRTRNDMANQ